MPSLFGAPVDKAPKIFRIANSLKWRGAPAELIARGITRDKLSKIFFMARLGAEHLTSEAHGLDPEEVIRATRLTPESHLITVLEDEAYSPARARHHSDATAEIDRRTLLLERLVDKNACRRIGAPTLRAYFRYKPLAEHELKQHAQLARYQQKQFRDFDNPFRDKEALLKPDDTNWLTAVAAEGVVLDPPYLEKLNDYIRLGSRDARFQRNRGSHNPTIVARHAFLEALGWMHEDHPLAPRIATFLRLQPPAISPSFIVQSLRFADKYGIDPINFLARCPSLAPGDIKALEERYMQSQHLLRVCGKRDDVSGFVDKNVKMLFQGRERLDRIIHIAAVYRSKLPDTEALSDLDIRALTETPIEAHLLALLRDNITYPRKAYQRYRRMSSVFATEQLREFLGVRDAIPTDDAVAIAVAGLAQQAPPSGKTHS